MFFIDRRWFAFKCMGVCSIQNKVVLLHYRLNVSNNNDCECVQVFSFFHLRDPCGGSGFGKKEYNKRNDIAPSATHRYKSAHTLPMRLILGQAHVYLHFSVLCLDDINIIQISSKQFWSITSRLTT